MLQPIFEIISSLGNHSQIQLHECSGNSRIPVLVSGYTFHNVKYDNVPLCVHKKFKKSRFSRSIFPEILMHKAVIIFLDLDIECKICYKIKLDIFFFLYFSIFKDDSTTKLY